MNIWRDTHGVAHVEGRDLVDVIHGEGYAHGRDRALEIFLMRILGQGRGSELLDASDEMLAIDTFFRRMNWAQNMESELGKITPEMRALFQAYCDGVNTACSEKFPWELKLLGCRFEPWCIEDILMTSRMFGYISLAQSQGEMERLLVEMVQAGVSEEKLHDLFPGILQGLDIGLIRQVKFSERIVLPSSLWNTAAVSMMASNNWVVSGTKTASGKPILCNDPHLEINRLPSVWYEIVLKTPDQYAAGASFPGVPGILVGRTSDLAWGATYAFMDATDSWIEQCEAGMYFREPDAWHTFTERKEVIKRKKKPPVEIVFYENEHGILDGDPNETGFYLTTAWAPSMSGAVSVSSIVSMWHAKDVKQGMETLRNIESAWSFVLADVHGNIGFQMSGMMPKRRDGISGFVPLPGWKEENDWMGFEDPANLPMCSNPEQGFFVTANQDLNAFGTAHPITLPMGPYRSDRITELLEANDQFSCTDMYAIHHDVYSTQARAFMDMLVPLLPDTPTARILKEWDCRYSADSKGAWIFKQFYTALRRQVFGEHGFGPAVIDHLETHTGIFNDFYLNFDRVLLSDESAWFNGSSREELYTQALNTALAQEPRTWGESRQLILAHILFGGRLPRWLGFDRGPITLIGDLATPHQGQIFESGGRKTCFAPSLKMAIDLSTDEIHTALPGGPSDRRFSRWYCSDLENWINGIYKRISPDSGQARLPFP